MFDRATITLDIGPHSSLFWVTVTAGLCLGLGLGLGLVLWLGLGLVLHDKTPV